MATSLIEPLQISQEDPNAVEDWLDRLDNAIAIVLFGNAGSLPTDEEAKTVATNLLKKNYLLSCIGIIGYKYLKSYCSPNIPAEKTYVELIKILKDHLAPKPKAISEQYKFGMLKQYSGESLSSFMSRVKEAGHTCNFGALYDQMIRNRFISGLRDSQTQSSLLSLAEDEMSAEKAFETAITKERAKETSQFMAGNSNVNYVQGPRQNGYTQNDRNPNRNYNRNQTNTSQKSRKSNTLEFSKCTMKGHTHENCRVMCYYCKKPGHISKNCFKLKNKSKEVHHTQNVGNHNDPAQQSDSDEIRDQDYSRGYNNYSQYEYDGTNANDVEEPYNMMKVEIQNAHHVTNSNVGFLSYEEQKVVGKASTDSVPCKLYVSGVCENNKRSNIIIKKCYEIDSIDNSKQSEKSILKVILNGKYVFMEFDSGAAVSCMNSNSFKELGLTGVQLVKCHVNLCVANGQIVKSPCKAMVTVKFNNYSCKLPLYLVDVAFPTLFGFEWIQAVFGESWLSKLVGLSVNHVETNQKFNDSVKSSSIFQPGIGIVKGFEACVELKAGARPKFCNFRKPPFAFRGKIGKKLDSLEEEGFLIKVDHSKYASPIHPVMKADGDVRLCGDYKSTLNPNVDTKCYPLPTIEDCLWEIRGSTIFTKLDIKQAYNHLPLREADQLLTTINTGLVQVDTSPVRMVFCWGHISSQDGRGTAGNP